MVTVAPEGNDARPPHHRAAGPSGAAVRPTARLRPVVPVRLRDSDDLFRPSDPYVRKFWVAAIGAGAVAELMRLARAGEKGEGVRLPRHLPALLRAGLVSVIDGSLEVASRFPPVPAGMRGRFTPSLAAEHSRYLLALPLAANRK